MAARLAGVRFSAYSIQRLPQAIVADGEDAAIGLHLPLRRQLLRDG